MTAPVWPVATVTGHRPQGLAPGQLDWATTELRRIVQKLRDLNGTRQAVTGMALGVDMAWAEVALRAGLDVWPHVPFKQQPLRWSDTDRRRYREILRQSLPPTVYGDCPDGPDSRRIAVGLLHKRNDGMLDATVKAGGVVVAVLRSSAVEGGTLSAFGKAIERGLPVIRIDPDRCTTTIASLGRTVPNYEQGALL